MTWSFDVLGRVVANQAPGKPAATMAYTTGDFSADPVVAPQVITTQPDGVTSSTTFDKEGRPTGTTYSDSTPAVAYTFDVLGRLTKTTGAVETTRAYDSLGQPTSVTRAGRSISYSYSAPGRVSGITYPNNKSVSRGYDGAGRWVSVTDWDGQTTGFDYNANGQVSQVNGPNGVTTDRLFDPAGNIAKVTFHAGGVTWPVTYDRTPAGQVDSVVQWGGGPGWGYDADGQVVSGSNPTTQFGYDADSNPIDLAGVTQEFNSSGELCWSDPGGASGDCGTPPSGATSYTCDVNGQRTAAGSDAFGYDATGAMVSASQGSSSYTYAADGLRTAKTAGGSTTVFSWDDTASVPQLIQDGNDYYICGPGGLPVERLGASPKRWLAIDRFGSVIAAFDGGGQVVANQDFDTWGNVTSQTGESISLGWQGQYLDDETGLYYLRNRYYDAATGQFTTPDPLEDLTGDRYGYAGNDPVNQSDPLGLWWGEGAWDATGGKVVSGVNNLATDPSGFAQRNRHALIDIGTGVLAVGACSTGVGCLAVVGGSMALHLGSDAVFDDDRRISVAEAAFRSGTSTALGGLNRRILGQGATTAGFGLPARFADYRLIPPFLTRRAGVVAPRWIAGTWFGGTTGTRWALLNGLFGSSDAGSRVPGC